MIITSSNILVTNNSFMGNVINYNSIFPFLFRIGVSLQVNLYQQNYRSGIYLLTLLLFYKKFPTFIILSKYHTYISPDGMLDARKLQHQLIDVFLIYRQ